MSETIVHACPPGDSGLMPCCGRTPFEVPESDRLTTIDAAVTCQGSVSEATGAGPKCRGCGCTDEDCTSCVEISGYPCSWVEDDLCSVCAAIDALADGTPWPIDNGWLGELFVDPAETMQAEGYVVPVITWRMTPGGADAVARALTALEDIGEILRARGGDGPVGNQRITGALRTALWGLATAGRVRLVEDRYSGWTWHEPLQTDEVTR